MDFEAVYTPRLLCFDSGMAGLTELEVLLLNACRIAKRQLEYDGDDKTAFVGAAFEALTKAINAAEMRMLPPTITD